MKKIILIFSLCLSALFTFSQTSIGAKKELPSQTGHSGQYLKTNGTTPSWATVTAGLSGSLIANYIPYAVSSTSLANSTIFTYTNGVTIFKTSLDGEGSGNSNFTYSTSVGGLRNSYYGQSGYGTVSDFYTNGVKNSQFTEFSGYLALVSKSRFSIKSFNDGGAKLFIDMSSGYVGVGNDYFVPDDRFHVIGNVKIDGILKLPTVTNSSPVNGDIWNDGTHLYFRIGGVTKQLDN